MSDSTRSASPVSETRIELLRTLLRDEAGPRSVSQIAENLSKDPAGVTDAVALRRAVASLEAVFLVAAADGQIVAAEVAHLNDMVERVLQRKLAREHTDKLLDAFAEDLDRDDYEVRVRAISAALDDEWSRRAAFVMAVGVAHSDGNLQPEEQDVIDLMAREFALDEAVIARILVRAKE